MGPKLLMTTYRVKPPKERQPGPYPAGRRCACGATLSRYNPSDSCAPCSGGDWISPDPTTSQLHDVQVARLEQRLAA